MKKRQMKKMIPANTDFCTGCPFLVKTGKKIPDVLYLADGTEKDVMITERICKYTKITTTEDVSLMESLKVCGEKIPSY